MTQLWQISPAHWRDFDHDDDDWILAEGADAKAAAINGRASLEKRGYDDTVWDELVIVVRPDGGGPEKRFTVRAKRTVEFHASEVETEAA